MALSNILKEPRREITETLVGLGVVIPLLAADYFISAWLGAKDKDLPWPFWMAVAPMIAGVVMIVAYGFANLIHAIGEVISDWLADRGIELRPKR